MAYTERELFIRTVAAESRGEDLIGQALVARIILNRAGLIQSGAVGKGTFLANDASITGVIYGKNQFQVVSDGSINNNFSQVELDNAEKAIAIAENRSDLRGRLEARNTPPNEINSAMASTGFRTGSAFNDPSQNINVTKFGNHYFNTAGNSNLQIPNATVKTTESPGSTQSSAPVETAKDPATKATTTSDNPVPVPDKDLEFNNPYFQLDNERLDAEIEANRKQIAELNEKSSDLWTDEEKEKYKMLSAETDALFAAKFGNDLQEQADADGCVARETPLGMTFKNTPACEKLFNSVAFRDALTRMQEKQAMPDPCGTSEMAKINTQLQKFFTVLKGIKKYADLYVNGTINKIQNLTALIRSTSQIIGAVLKTLVNRLRDFLIDKIRRGIEDLIDMILPTVLKAIKSTIVQTVIDNIFCAFKDVISNLANLVGDFLFEMIGKIVNVPFCAAQQFTNALVNNVAAIVDQAVGPILDQINDVLGGVTKIIGNVFQALDYILGFEAFLCAKPNCPEIKTFKASPWGGPSQSQIDDFTGFLAPPTAGDLVKGATDFIDGIEIFGEPLGNSAGTAPSSITECDPSAYKCGPPRVEIFGGGGIGAVGEAIVDNIGRTIGVSVINGGSGYTRPPFVSFIDGCENTFTSGYAVISESGVGGLIDGGGVGVGGLIDGGGVGVGGPGDGVGGDGGTGDGVGGDGVGGDGGTGDGVGGQVTGIILTTRPVAPPLDGRTEFDLPSDTGQPSGNDFIVSLEGFRILDTGVGYTTNDDIAITPDIPGLEASVQMTEFGQIVSIQIGTNVSGLSGYPDIEINSLTGEGAIIEPILSFARVSDFDETESETIGDVQLVLDGPINTLRGRSVLVEKGFTRKDLVRVVDCVS